MEDLQEMLKKRVNEIIEKEAPKVENEQWRIVQCGIGVNVNGRFALIIGRQSKLDWKRSQSLYMVEL